MRNKIRLVVFLISVNVLLHGCATLEDGRLVLKDCATLILPGSYVLANNVFSTSHCFKINNDHVTLDLNGFTIKGDSSGTGITTFEAPYKNIAIYNGNIIGFEKGIELRNVRDVIIEKVRVTNNTSYGIFAGINAPGGANNIIKDCIAIDNGSTDIVTSAILINNVADRIATADSVLIGNKFEFLDVSRGVVVNNVGGNLLVGNCPTMIMGNQLNNLSTLDPPLIFARHCNVSHNIPSGLSP